MTTSTRASWQEAEYFQRTLLSTKSDDAAALKRRRKTHSGWDVADRASGGAYGRALDDFARRFPALTPMELRVCVLVKAMLPSWRIGEILGISEKTVENHRVNARKKLGCGHYACMRNALL